MRSKTAHGKRIPLVKRKRLTDENGKSKKGGPLRFIRLVNSSMDLSFLIIVLLLLIIGLVMMFSASYANAFYYKNNSLYYIERQIIFAVIGVAAMIFISYFDYHIWHKFAFPLLAISIILLVACLFFPAVNNAHRWIFIGPINFQPSEIAKLAVVLSFAQLTVINQKRIQTFTYGVLPYLVILGIVAALMLLEPHLSGTILILGMGAIMMFVGGTSLKWFAIGGGLAGTGLVCMIFFTDFIEYASTRVSAWLNPFADPRGSAWQTIQSLYAIGSGGVLGLGLGNSRQKHLYIPEPQNDFVFSVVCEELGLVGATIIIILFALLVWRGFLIAMRAPDIFGSMITVGLVTQIGLQTVLNIAVVTNTVPNTGISLPFFSSGGTALSMLLFQMGVVLSVSRQSNLKR